jgi:putative phosphoserine phosphatase/1-acylglycerol-3-phosphate O-acyltransferase
MNRRRPPSAAFFDLDRTLIAGPSGPAFSEHLDAAGISQRSLPGVDLVAATYRMLGETAITAPTARLAAKATAGWPVEAVRAAAQAAADDLLLQVQPFAPGVIAEHREAGRLVVMATTSPAPLVTPLAELLGFDAVVATEWASADGTYTGEIDGPLVWGRGKLEAVEKWAADAGVDLASSYAYSDSYYDEPLLSAVGHPTAVNADLRLVALARLKGWPLRHFDLPEGVLKIFGRELQEWTRPLQRPEMLTNVHLDVAGIDKIPRTGPVIAVFNHRSYFDASVVGAVLGPTGRSFRFLGKKEVFDAPIIGFLSKMAGGIRVNRASGSSEPLEHAIRALQAGEAVALAPEGTIPRGPAFFDPVLKGRWGAARLAQATHAPVIPIGLWGTEQVWPRNHRLPRFDLAERPTVRVRVGDPVELKHRSLDADTKRIMAAIVDQLPAEARVARTPTPEELAATYPPGYRGDPTQETERRPGTDT